MEVGDEVLTLNIEKPYTQEWKPVRTVISHAIDPERDEDRLYRMQGSGMDVIATRDHRMLLARLSSTGLSTSKPIIYAPVGELLPPALTYSAYTSTATRFLQSKTRAVVRASFNNQPSVKVVIPGLERLCERWWEEDEQLGFLQFLGCWLADGHLAFTTGCVCISQKKELALEWLETLLCAVFPRCWYRNVNSADPNEYVYTVRCPPLYEYLCMMAVGPIGYNPRDPTQLRNYPHFTYDAALATEEEKSACYNAHNCSGRATSKWTEAAMLAAFTASERDVAWTLCVSGGSVWEEEPDWKELPAKRQQVSQDEHGSVVDVPCGQAMAVEDAAHTEAVGAALQADGKIVWWNNSSWTVIDGHWFHLKRWMGDEAQIANVYSQLSRQQAIALLDGFCRADGRSKSVQYGASGEPTSQWSCSHPSFPLIDHLQLIGQLAGAAVDLHRTNRAGTTTSTDGRTLTFSVDHWALRFNFTESACGVPFQTALLAQPVDVSDDMDGRGYHDYQNDGRVYCITVADNSNFLTQRLSNKRLHSGDTDVVAHPVFISNCQDNDNSDGFMLSCDTCIAEGTPVALRYGLAVPIEAVRERGCQVLAVRDGDEKGAMGTSVVERGAVGSNVKGERAVCRLWLANGRFLDMTDDHPVFVRGKEGEAPRSRPAKELKAGWRHALNAVESEGTEEEEVAMAMMGADAAVDDCRLDTEDERSWSLSFADSGLPPLSFSPLPLPSPPHHSVVSHRDRALAFARVLGYVTGCGRRRVRTEQRQPQTVLSVAFQHWLDVDEWVKDVDLVMTSCAHSSIKHSIRASRRGRWRTTLPVQLSAVLSVLVNWQDFEASSSGAASPPAFLECSSSRPPTAFTREYVAALFGAMGEPVRCKRSSRLDLHSAVTLAIASHTSAFASASILMTHVSSLLSSLGINPSQQRIIQRHRVRRAARGSAALTHSVHTPHAFLHVTCPITFSRLISYRYAALKQLRLSVGCAYLHYRTNVTQQWCSFPTPLSASQSSSFVSQKWTKHIDSTMPTLHCSSSPSASLTLPTFSHFLSVIGLPSLFSTLSLPPTATSLPAYFLPIIAFQPLSSSLPVYDLSMQAGYSPSFTANSVAVHNCEVWQHGDCLQVNERSVPEQYFCELCAPDHPIHVHNDSVRKSAINKRLKGRGKAAKLAGLGSPQVESRKSMDTKQKKDVKMVEGRKEAVKSATDKDKPIKSLGTVVAASVEAAKKKKTKREDEAAMVGVAERRDGREQQPAAKKARVDDRVVPAAGKEKEEKQASAVITADVSPSLTSSTSASDLNELGSDGMDAREKKKLKKLLETIQKMEDQTVKKRKKSEGDATAAEGKDRDDTHVAVAAVLDDRAGTRAVDEDAAMDTSSPSSPNLSTARSVRAKLRAEREEVDQVPGQLIPTDASLGGGSAALTASAAASRKKKKSAAGTDSDDDTSDVVDFAFRRRRWQDVKRTSGSEMGPFYLGKKEWLLSGWRREKEREATGWDDRVKDEEVGVVKRAIDNWREEKKEREEEAHARELGAGTTRRRMTVQRAVDGVPTISKYEVVAATAVAEPDTNGDRKRKLDDDEGEPEHERERSPLFSPTKSNGTAHSVPTSAAVASSSAAAATPSAAVSRPSIPKVSRGMLNGLGSKGGVGTSAPGRLSNSRQSSLGAAQH